jgi:hypothetical protein
MAFNDKIIAMNNVTSSSNLSFLPTGNINWMVRNIVTEAEGTLGMWKVSGGLGITLGFYYAFSTEFTDLQLHCTNGIYYYFQNNNVATKKVSYEAIVTNDGSIGDTIVSDIQAITAGQALNIRPPVGQEWVIHNIGCDAQPGNLLRKITAGDYLLVERLPSYSLRTGLNLLCTYDNYVQIYNAGAIAGNFGYDGIRTK